MRRLTALRLVQWYHFQDELFDLGSSCLFLGDNGSGKSTVLDAIQLALVADLSEVRFNQAANEKSRRSLYGYVRWKLGSEDESRPGAVRYGRASCTSYVLLEFRDPDAPASDFTCGVCLEATETDTEVSRLHVVLPGARVRDVEVLGGDGDERYVRPLKEFRAWIREKESRGRYYSDAGTYRDEVRQRLGVLPDGFHALIVKALSFKPIGQVRQFVFDYLLDPRPIDTAALQDNLEHYKRLEGEARDAERRLAALEEIVAKGSEIDAQRKVARSHRWMELRADVDVADAASAVVEAKLEEVDLAIATDRTAHAQLVRQSKELESEYEMVLGSLEKHEVFGRLQQFDRKIEELVRQEREADEADATARKLMREQSKALDALLSDEARTLRRARPELFGTDDLAGASEPPAVVERLRATLDERGALEGRDLATWERRLGKTADSLRDARHRLERAIEEMKAEGAELQDEQRSLESGTQRYPPGVEALLHLLRTKLRGRREPKPVCELVEVPDTRWRDAVEGYLNTRRFDVIVAPEDYPRALSLYERHKREYVLPGRAPVFISGAGLVDIERLSNARSRPEPRSLAEQVETPDALARTYCDYALGDVVCVDDEQSLRKHRSAITDTVMVYRNFVARQADPKTYARHFLGAAARQRRIEEVRSRIAALAEEIGRTVADTEWIRETLAALGAALRNAARLPDLVERAAALPGVRANITKLSEQRARVDRKEIAALEAARDDVRRRRMETDEQKEAVHGRLQRLDERRSTLDKERATLADQRAEAHRLLADFAAALESVVVFEDRYAKERAEREPVEIHGVFERQRKIIETRVENFAKDLVALKTDYANRYGWTGDTRSESIAELVDERDLWRESKLPEYRSKIGDSKKRALEQLAEDVVFRLRENLLQVRRQIDELNRALKDVPFGSEQYQFTVEVEPLHKPFHDLVMDAGRFEKESLFGSQAVSAPETRKVLEDLLERLVESEAEEVKTELEAKADYREYFRYDLKILHADGHFSLYDKVAGDKSGGETQTPYYIAILASMFRLYRSGRGALDGKPTCGVVLLDEAFGKMDEGRIRATLTYARKLGLQLLLATPKERSELVAPWVDRSIYIHKDARTGEPSVFEVTKEIAALAEETDDGVDRAAGSPVPPPGRVRA